ncbi:MAG: hypothetical protein JXA78_18335 [Anaerolineales bacterium]|nr:hypothetical protein [Anaerolineales bacterium]
MERFVNPAASDDYAGLHSQEYLRAMDQERLARKCAAGQESSISTFVGTIGQGLRRRFSYVFAGLILIVLLISRLLTAAVDPGKGNA